MAALTWMDLMYGVPFGLICYVLCTLLDPDKGVG